MKAIYTVLESTVAGKPWFFIYDQNKTLKADCSTKIEAEEEAAFYTSRQEDIATPFDYQSGMYGADSEYAADHGNEE